MIVASIDIGTNTVLLLISEVNLDNMNIIPMKEETRMPRIGKGTKKSGFITSEKIDLLYGILEEYNEIIKAYKCERVILTGTNAFRLANNTSSIIKEIKQRFNYDLNVVSGEMEAKLAFLGATSSIKENDTIMVIDIGGSSTEIITGKKNIILSEVSLQIGSVAATENFLKHSPPLKSEIKNLERETEKLISDVDLRDKTNNVIAIAGTATTAACMVLGLKEFQAEFVNNFELKKEMITKLLDDLFQLNQSEILARYGRVMEGREDIILAGIIILNQIMKKFSFEKVMVSTRGIRYGAIINYFQKKFSY